MKKDDWLPLVPEARAGNPVAFDGLVRRFQDMAFGYGMAIAPDRATAEDAAQDAFLEAFRCLPSLREAAAFPSWLRKLVFKHCDRATRGGPRRPTLPLEAARHAPSRDWRTDPTAAAERAHDTGKVRAAVSALPEAEREVTSLFYFGGCSTGEIAAFLDLPDATVRTRLHRARQRLRKELSDMTQQMNEAAKPRPSESDRFVDRVLDEMAEEYRRQRKEDPATADRSLLARAKERLAKYLEEDTPLALKTVQTGASFLFAMGEDDMRVALLRAFLRQARTVSEEAWGRFFLVQALASAGRAEECVAAHEEMIRWARATFPANPPRLRADWDFAPTDDPAAKTYPVDTLMVWTLYVPDTPHRWVDVGRGDEWLRYFYETLERTPATDANRLARFHFLRLGVVVETNLGHLDEAWKLADRVAALADEVTAEADVLYWQGFAADMRMLVAKLSNDRERLRSVAAEAIALLERYERSLPPGDAQHESGFLLLRDNIASLLSDGGLFDLAVPLLRAQIATGKGTPWNYARLAVSVYATTADRTEALDLLRQGALRTDRGDIWDIWDRCRKLPEFAAVADDPEFAVAAARQTAGG